MEASRNSLGTAVESEWLLAQAFLENYISVVQLDLQSGRCIILKCELEQELEGSVLVWSDLLERYAGRRVFAPDKEKVCSISLERLRRFCWEKTGEFPMEVHCNFNSETQWVQVAVTDVGMDGNTVMVTTRNRGKYADS